MKIRKRRRYFSLIFVPDQEKDPKSISLTYFKGRVFLAILILLAIHAVAGGLAYYRVFRLGRNLAKVKYENKELILQNKKIEQIAHDFEEIRRTDKKIRKAFGTTLNLSTAEPPDLSEISNYVKPENTKPAQSSYKDVVIDDHVGTMQNNLYFLTHRESGYYNPGYLPTLLPVEGFLTTHFQKGGWFSARSHLGIDIAAKKGSVIRAAGSGIVLIADWTPDFGNVVIISHGNGLFSYYAHAMRLIVGQGTRVKKGDMIALLGSSGISSAPHLHFEIWKDGKPLDPEKYIYALQRRNVGMN
ncbi:M23 family metallopeptidase [bacterium]|nr:M23 family metallopeptidase [bacterium]